MSDTLPAGRNLDALIAEQVMGWHEVPAANGIEQSWWWNEKEPLRSTNGDVWAGGWRPSTDISAAWEIVEKLGRDGWWLTLQSDWPMRQWNATIRREKDYVAQSGMADTAPLAICRAALAAVASLRFG